MEKTTVRKNMPAAARDFSVSLVQDTANAIDTTVDGARHSFETKDPDRWMSAILAGAGVRIFRVSPDWTTMTLQ